MLKNWKMYRKTPRPVAKDQPFTPCIPSVYPGNGSFHAVATETHQRISITLSWFHAEFNYLLIGGLAIAVGNFSL